MKTLACCAPALLLPTWALGQGPVTRLVPDDLHHPQQMFGSSVALYEEYAFVGARNDSTKGHESGALYVFDRTTGAQLAKLYTPDGVTGGFFGESAAGWGDHVLVGCPYDDQQGPFTGSVYELQLPSGMPVAKYTGSTGKFGSFGHAIAVDGDRAVISAYRDSADKYEKGAVFVVDLVAQKKITKLVAADGKYGDEFGRGVAFGEGKIVVGAPKRGGAYEHGRVYVYDDQTFEELYTLSPGGGKEWHFGWSVAIADGRVLVGAPGPWDESPGAVFVYDAQSGELQRILRPEPSGTPLGGDLFGNSVRAEGELAVVGAPFQNGFAKRSGVAFLFHVPSGEQLARFAVPGTADSFGSMVVAFRSGSVLAGAQYDGAYASGGGGAWLFELEHELGTSYCGPAALNSTGASAVIGAHGSSIVAANALELRASQLPPGELGTFLAGDARDFVPFAGGSQGHLCLGGNLARFRDLVLETGADGRISAAIDLQHLPTFPPSAVQPGEAWNFQAWFRDHNPGVTSNFTDGLRIRFH